MRKKQSGSALILAVFIIIVISLLGASLVSLQRDSAESTSYEVYAARAYLAAYSASEIALVDLFPLGETEVSDENCTVSGEDENTIRVDLPDERESDGTIGFHGCSASYTCETISAASSTTVRYSVTSTAICKNSEINTRRQITVEATSL